MFVTQAWTVSVCFSKLTRIILARCIADKAFLCSVLTEVFSFLYPQPQINSLLAGLLSKMSQKCFLIEKGNQKIKSYLARLFWVPLLIALQVSLFHWPAQCWKARLLLSPLHLLPGVSGAWASHGAITGAQLGSLLAHSLHRAITGLLSPPSPPCFSNKLKKSNNMNCHVTKDNGLPSALYFQAQHWIPRGAGMEGAELWKETVGKWDKSFPNKELSRNYLV